jgi:hypothetical protein
VLAYLRSTKTVASSTGMCRRSSMRVAGVFGASTSRWDEADARWRWAWAWRGQRPGPPCRELAPRLNAAASGARCRAGSPRGAWSPLRRQFAGDRDLRRWPAVPRDLSRWLVRRRSRRRLMAGRTHALAGSHRTEGTPPGPHLASQPRRGQAATPARHRAIALRQLAGDRDSSPFRWRGKRRVEWRAWGRPSRWRGRGGKGERRNASGGP